MSLELFYYNKIFHFWACGVFTESQDSNPEFMKHLSDDPLDKEEEKEDSFTKSLFRYIHQE